MRSVFLLSIFLTVCLSLTKAAERPNIVWILVDDMSANFSCYGEKTIKTPIVDQLAADGLRFTRAYATAPVCSTFRSSLITGMYQTTNGTHHHRSGRGEHRIELPDGVEPIPAHFQKAGYWTCIGSGVPGLDGKGNPTSSDRLGKTDYNFDWNQSIYDSHDWAGRADGQPFFMQVQLNGGKLRGSSQKHYDAFDERVIANLGSITDPEKVELPPYYPRDPILLKDWSTYLDSVRITDWHVGRVLARLEAEGLAENTLVVFFTDHGISHARGKQFLYDEGTHIPIVIRGPGIAKGQTRDDLVEHIDVATLSLAAAGIEIPDSIQGRDLLAKSYAPRDFVYAARDRCGEATDRIRSVRTGQYLYIRNFHPQRPHLMPSQYKDGKLIIQRLRKLHAEGALNDLSRRLLFAPDRPSEELYDYHADPWQTQNLADNSKHQATLQSLRSELDRWIKETGDLGSESPEVYDLEVQFELDSAKPNSDRYKIFGQNAEVYKRWAAEGK